MRPLPPDRRVDKEKVTQYLLHPLNSRGKALFFERMGFSLDRWEQLADALLEHADSGTLTSVVASTYGARYVLIGSMKSPALREPAPIVTTVWQQVVGADGVRLITAYPG